MLIYDISYKTLAGSKTLRAQNHFISEKKGIKDSNFGIIIFGI